jgi:hypothetical protein
MNGLAEVLNGCCLRDFEAHMPRGKIELAELLVQKLQQRIITKRLARQIDSDFGRHRRAENIRITAECCADHPPINSGHEVIALRSRDEGSR